MAYKKIRIGSFDVYVCDVDDIDDFFMACGKQLLGCVRKRYTVKKLIAADTKKSLTGEETSAIE